MATVTLTVRAEQDLAEIWAWIARDDPATADRILAEFERVCARLGSTPRMGRPRPDLGLRLRSLVVERWLVVYRLDDGDDILVARVVSSARDTRRVKWDPT